MDINNIASFINEVNCKQHLAHLIRCTEEELFREDKKFISDMKKVIRDTGSRQVDQLFLFERDNVFSKITLANSDDVDSTQLGFTILFDKGATIYVTNTRSHLETHAIIAHEIGHLLLHTDRLDGYRRDFKENRNPDKWPLCEIEASHFAEQYLRSMRNYFNGEDDSYSYKEKCYMIRDAILAIHDDYDLSKIDVADDM